jgi:ligand-binding sensor domain-containing protein
VQLSGARDFTAWSALDGLPADRVYAVAPRNDGVWVGTERGLAWVSDTSETRDRRTRNVGRVLLENTPVRALAAIGDTLWIGTDAGLVALPGRTASLARPVTDDPAFQRPIRALAWSDTMLIVATDDQLLRIAPRGGSPPSRINIDIPSMGYVTRIAIDENTIFVAGSNGILAMQRNGGLTRRLSVDSDIAGLPLDVAVSRDWLWIATTRGLVRVARNSDGSLR